MKRVFFTLFFFHFIFCHLFHIYVYTKYAAVVIPIDYLKCNIRIFWRTFCLNLWKEKHFFDSRFIYQKKLQYHSSFMYVHKISNFIFRLQYEKHIFITSFLRKKKRNLNYYNYFVIKLILFGIGFCRVSKFDFIYSR